MYGKTINIFRISSICAVQLAKSSFASTLYRKRGLFLKNVRLKLNMIVRPGIVIKSLMNIRTKNQLKMRAFAPFFG